MDKKVISVINQKRGVDKTKAVINLTLRLLEKGKKIFKNG
tara:strand:+ start:66 stop:185 length:120 start_codon:yes stop_codon:yes gene_type:complete